MMSYGKARPHGMTADRRRDLRKRLARLRRIQMFAILNETQLSEQAHLKAELEALRRER